MESRHTAILMGTCNGAPFLRQQVQSILSQTLPTWSLWVSDDGSTDQTLPILKAQQAPLGSDRLRILTGPTTGFVSNFLSLACHPDIRAHYFAFADQDDIWLPDKLQHAIEALESVPVDLPALYCSRTLIIDETGVEGGYSRLNRVEPSFANALIQNLASGNTMVFNAAARELLQQAGQDVDVFAHDWWLYLVVMAVGGTVLFDTTPRVKYRQHQRNQIGATVTLAALFQRTRLDRNGHLRSTFRRNIAALSRIREQITPENLALLDRVEQLTQPNPLCRICAFLRLPFKRQQFLGNCSLGLAVWLGRL
jgi:glycosyltransferase involved in cell wall biosynthesis